MSHHFKIELISVKTHKLGVRTHKMELKGEKGAVEAN
jgi:hypothetical protein